MKFAADALPMKRLVFPLALFFIPQADGTVDLEVEIERSPLGRRSLGCQPVASAYLPHEQGQGYNMA